MKRTITAILIGLVTINVFSHAQHLKSEKARAEHIKWIDSVLRSVQDIKVGTTRAELLKVFTTEGGISNAFHQTYVHRDCPYIKVDVKFAASGWDKELLTDKIAEISRPYLQSPIAD